MKLINQLQNAKVILDKTWGMLCLFSVPSLCAVVGFWFLAPAHSAIVSANYLPILYAPAGETTRIVSGLEVTIPSQKTMYHFTLMDQNGNSVYKWPPVVSLNRKPEFSDVTIQLPNELEGEYQLVADVTYEINPVRNENIQVRVAKVTIYKKPQL